MALFVPTFINQNITFENIKDDIKQLNKEDKDLHFVEVTMMKTEAFKSPGTDGLTEFLKYFWDDVQKSLYKTCMECIQTFNTFNKPSRKF